MKFFQKTKMFFQQLNIPEVYMKNEFKHKEDIS